MNEIVFVTSKGNVATDSLKVAEVFGKAHKDVLKNIRKQIETLKEIEPNFTERNFALSEYKDVTGRSLPKYFLTEKAFTMITMSYTTSEAMKFKVKYINEFDKMKEHIKQKEATLLSPLEQISQALILADGVIKNQQLQLEEQKPKVVFAESVEESNDLIYIKDLATILKQNGYDTGEIRLFKKLREEGFLCLDNSPTQRALNLKVFQVVEHEKKGKITFTTKVTGKGQTYFVNKFLKEESK